MKKIDLTDLTVLIPIRIDSMVRLENMMAVVEYLYKHFDINVIVLEADKYNNGIVQRLLPKAVEYLFIEDYDPVYYRTYYINKMVERVTTPYVAVWDADVVFPIGQVVAAMEILRSGEVEVAFPYDGRFMDLSRLIRERYIVEKDIDMLARYEHRMSLIYGTNMRGGAFIANTEKYRKAGMENELFYGWGPEDWERCERWNNLGYRTQTIEGVLYHLSHPRNMNGKHNSEQQKRSLFYELHVTENSSTEEIKQRLHLD